jgi:hypothetical protein
VNAAVDVRSPVNLSRFLLNLLGSGPIPAQLYAQVVCWGSLPLLSLWERGEEDRAASTLIVPPPLLLRERVW